MSRYTVQSIILGTLFILSSCLVTQSSQPVPALLEQPSAETRLILEKAIGYLLNSQPVKLANKVFTTKDTVIIEGHQLKDNYRNPRIGRKMHQADTVSLFIEGEKCYLKHG